MILSSSLFAQVDSLQLEIQNSETSLTPELTEFYSPEQYKYFGDLRSLKPISAQISSDNIAYLGVELGYYVTSFLQIGMGFHSRRIVDYLFNHKSIKEITVNTTNGQRRAEVDPQVSRSYLDLNLKIFPFYSSGFFLQLSKFKRLVEFNQDLKAKDNGLALAEIKLTSSSYPTAFEIGWQGSAADGYNFSLSIGRNLGDDLNVKASTKSNAGQDYLNSAQQAEIEKELSSVFNDEYKNRWLFSMGVGKVF